MRIKNLLLPPQINIKFDYRLIFLLRRDEIDVSRVCQKAAGSLDVRCEGVSWILDIPAMACGRSKSSLAAKLGHGTMFVFTVLSAPRIADYRTRQMLDKSP